MRWRDWRWWCADFSAVSRPGRCFVSIDGASPPLVSRPFRIAGTVLDLQLMSDLLHYVKSQRCTGIFDAADRACPTHGSERTADVHGGWTDASGDVSKVLSHLSYANTMNPQQTPQLVWCLVEGRARLPAQPSWFDERIVDEALHGADFLVRMQHPDGWFHTSVFDRWSKDVRERVLCSFSTQQGHRHATMQAGFRQGGGSAIAALARCASALPRDGDFTRARYLSAAERGFVHLERHTLAYLDDGRENLIDDACALLAAGELFAATGAARWLDAAEARAERLLSRQHPEGWFWVDDERTRSWFHAVDAGLPLLALLRFIEAAPGTADVVREPLARALRQQVALAEPGPGNPFGYPRQYVLQPGGPDRVQFFMPHDNPSGYWWQGENARLASIACACLAATRAFADDPALCEALRRTARGAFDWLFGLNPFDVCMMQGAGHNPPRYEPDYWNAPGGVCNGITAGLDDEDDIDFRWPWETDPKHSWRWTEQWLPHAAWLFAAIAQQPTGRSHWDNS
jgi:hypothetical protein